ncbi:MAG: FecR domain-containing protein [Gammaproteobacteria bacterium]
MISLLRAMLFVGGVTVFWGLRIPTTEAADCDPSVAIGKMVSIQGAVTLNHALARLNDRLCQDDLIAVGPYSRAAFLLFATETTVRVDQDTEVRILPPPPKRRSLLDLLKGGIFLFSREPQGLDVQTPFVNAGIEGTEFQVRVAQDRTFVTVFEGKVVAKNARGRVQVGSNQAAVALKNAPPKLIETIRPEDAVKWALHYQPILDALYNPARPTPALREAVGTQDQRNVGVVLARLGRVPPAGRDVQYHLYRAALLMAVGQADQAQSDINRALQQNPASGNALALQAIIALTRNDKDRAFALASQGVEREPRSATAHIALSYAEQARFDIDAALASSQAAVERDPVNVLALARLSELWLSKGDLDNALAAAKRAVALNAHVARTQTVLGFAYLTRIDIENAKQAFERAITLDQTDPLPRLGLGLAKIRQGQLQPGREDLAIAVGLDPLNSLLRSYLGKAYFEEKRDRLAGTQYEIAKQQDPRDPTPWFYDAIRKQTENRPVEALQDVQKSIELNDNRAVYRSRFLLDQDSAARSASLGRIYGDLGFEQLALLEGWKSVNDDPSDYAGHRLLADSYAALPRHEIARVSELLQSQLRQPLNQAPIQPQLAETNLFVVSGAGPAEPAFNEFNPLFVRDGVTTLSNGVIGSNSIKGDDFVASFLSESFSISAGQYHYETSGFRENNDIDQNIYNLFSQLIVTDKTSIQAEFRYREEEKGDQEFRFDQDSFLEHLRQKEKTKSFRIGAHHIFSSNSDFIANISYQDRDSELTNPGVIHKTDIEGYTAELQYQYTENPFKITTGLGEDFIENSEVFDFSLFPDLSPNTRIEHKNFYLYSYLTLSKEFITTLGVSEDLFSSNFRKKNQFSPKFGILWTPSDTTTLRAAAFRTLKRAPVSNQSIEPTAVAGFNQFFDDVEGSDTQRYGIAIDQKLSPQLFAGAEFSKRNLTAPLIISTTGEVVIEDHRETLGRGYLYWIPHPWWVFNSEYQYEAFDIDLARSFIGLGAYTELKTHRFLLSAGFFHPSGFKAEIKATYNNQEGKFGGRESGLFPGKDSFWVVDASASYQLPGRSGIISLTAENIFAEKFKFQDTDPASPREVPRRLILVKASLYF